MVVQGFPAQETCWKCGASIPSGFSFCGRCGARLDRQGLPTETPDFSPAKPDLTAEDRRTVTVLFADLSGFTSLGEQLDPEELTALVQDSLGELIEDVRGEEGGLTRQIGDALMAVFGAPGTHEDDPVRAVRAALAMQSRMVDINRRLAPVLGRPLKLHVGINTGLVVMGRSVEGARTDRDPAAFTVLGDAVNVASRLQDLAGPGQILVGESTHAATEWAFDYRALPPLTLRGKQERVQAFECMGARSSPVAARGITRGIASRLRGRETELREVTSGLDRLREGHGGILCVVGDPGVGKSRLIAEARTRVSGDALLWLEGRSYSVSKTESYRPFGEIVRTFAGIGHEDDEEASWKKLEAAVGTLLPDEASETAPYLATLGGIEVLGEGRERLRYLDGDALGRQIFRSSRKFFRRLTEEQPVVLTFEDWHWADESSEALLEHLLPLVHTAPLLVCCVTRPDPETPGERLRHVAAKEHSEVSHVVELGALSPTDAGLLVDDLLENASPKAKDLMLQKTEGNPFFLEEMIRSLIDTGVAVPSTTSGRWRLTTDLGSVSIPDTVEGIIMARFQRLDDEAKELLRVASVIGRTFDYEIVCNVLGPDVKLDRHLDELLRLELIRERARDGNRLYSFKHALTQETVYESMLLKTRRELHRRVGSYLERAYADCLEDYYSILAYHFAHAEDWATAHEYLMDAGDYAGRMAADAESLRFYREAVAAYGRAFGDQWDPLQRATLERKMGEALFRIGRNDQARELIADAVRILGRPFPTSPSRVRNAIMRQVLKRVARPFLPSYWRQPPDSLRQRAEELDRIYNVMGWIDYFVDSERFALACFMRLRVAEWAENRRGIAGGSAAVGVVLDHIPMPRLAMQYHRRAVALSEEVGDPVTIGLAYLGMAYHTQHTLGQPEEALVHQAKSAKAYWAAGELRGWGAMAWLKAGILRRHGKFAESIELCRELVRVGEESADDQISGWGMAELGKCRLEQGYPEEAIPLLEESVKRAREIPDYQTSVAASGDIGLALIELGRVDDAISVLEQANETIDRRRLRGFLCTRVRLGLAEAYVLAADRSDSSQRKEWLEKADKACDTAMKAAKIDREGLPGAYRHRGSLEWLRGARRSAKRSWQRSVAFADETEAPYERALTLLEMGKRTGSEPTTSEGRALLAQLRAATELPAEHREPADPASDHLPVG